ncbi:hypothetical protein [Mesorhizobium sp. Root102]|uniref:hypothetical protein n=1 Tax=Mesorhizobium sp. Root102 TaxID=1736422 RepID=UPI0012E3A450|nr:hypothetical protein [Mesorhizobium sp. Root102]
MTAKVHSAFDHIAPIRFDCLLLRDLERKVSWQESRCVCLKEEQHVSHGQSRIGANGAERQCPYLQGDGLPPAGDDARSKGKGRRTCGSSRTYLPTFPRRVIENEAELASYYERDTPGPETAPLFEESRELGSACTSAMPNW